MTTSVKWAGRGAGPQTDLDEKKRLAQEARDRADADLLRIQQEEDDEREAQRAQLISAREGHLVDARNFRELARKETDEGEKRSLLKMASEDEEKARQIALQLGITVATPLEEDTRPWLKRNRGLVALLQVIGILIAILYFYGQFTNFHDYIQELNAKLPIEKQLQPYDLTSIQKFFYEKMVVFTDLPVALLILFLIVPFVGFYVLPFLKSKKDFYTEFYEELTPWQRSIITTVFCLGLLFFLALSHSVKP